MSNTMIGEMVQISQSLYSFTFNAVIAIHEYIYSHSTTEFTFKKYIYSHLTVYFLVTIMSTHIYEMSSFTFNALHSFTKSFSSPEAALLLVSTKNRDIWPGPMTFRF